ncbi:TolB family protein [Herpetosiphon giganteus]|uniref:TolB family protein n=1 Tax=Herpetosiphon giganteus TaxID=2029754 RepID=UPI001957A7B2|nr:PD40 domain-containing protein [Herpetosiphon giganteus]MBM7842322.1 Tol biopolymer transport system component [Herpetosiphon giganteus]
MKKQLLSIGLLISLVGCGAASNSVTPAAQAPASIDTADLAGYCIDTAPITKPVIVGLEGNIWTLNRDGSDMSQLTTAKERTLIRDAAWSHDRKTLAYSLMLPPIDLAIPWLQSGIICGLDAATGKGRLLAYGEFGDALSEPSWAGDDQSLYVTRRRTFLNDKNQFLREEAAIVRYGLGSNQATVIIDGSTTPAVSPDGKQLVYVQPNVDIGFPSLMIAKLDGSNPQPLGQPDPPFKAIIAPRWSPDGSMVVVTVNGGPGAIGGGEKPELAWWERLLGVEVASAHGEPVSLWQITVSDGAMKPLAQNIDDGRISWNPDGKQFLYIHGYDGLMEYTLATGEERALTPMQVYWFVEWGSH